MTEKEQEKVKNPGEEGLYDPLIQCTRERRTVRSFLATPVADELIMKILEAGRLAPSGANSQPWEFIVVKNREILEEIGRIFVADRHRRVLDKVNFPGSEKSYLAAVPAMVVVAADPRWKQAYPSTDLNPELQSMYESNREMIFLQSVAAAIENMFLAAASLGLGMAWLSGFAENRMEQELRRLLKVPEPVRLMAGLPVGYAKARGRSKFRRPLEELIHYETYDPTRLKTDKFFQDYCNHERNRQTYGK